MADISREQIDEALMQREGYVKAPPEQQAAWREKAYADFGISSSEQAAPKAGLQSQGQRAPVELTQGVIRKPPALHPVFNVVDRLSPGTGGELQGLFNREAIPTLMTAGGGPLATGARLGTKGAALLESILGTTGRGINYATGIEPPSGIQTGLQIAAPLVARGTMAGIQASPKLLPGAGAALQEEGLVGARNIPNLIKPPPTPSSKVYEALEQSGDPRLNIPMTVNEIARLQKSEAKIAEGLKSDPLLSVTGGLKDMAGGRAPQTEFRPKTSGGMGMESVVTSPGKPAGMTFQEIKENIERLGKKIGNTTDAELKGAYKDLYKALLDDLNTASTSASGAQAKLFQEARQAYRRELAKKELAEIIETRGIKKQSEMLDQGLPNNVANWMNGTKDGKYFKESITPQELTKINAALKEWSKIPSVPAKQGRPAGLGSRLAIAGVGGAAGGYLSGGGMGAAVGALAADKAAEYVSRALMSDTGRRVLLKVVRANGGRFGQREAAVVSAALAGELGNEISE